MAQATILPSTSTIATGNQVFVTTATTQVNLEFAPQANVGFTGTVVIESATSAQPISTDWFTIATLVFSAHTTNVDINLYISNNPWLRARTTANSGQSTVSGSISAYIAY